MASRCDLAPTFQENIELIASLVYGPLSIILYFVHIAIIVRRNSFKHPFFYQFILLSISNIVIWIDVQISQRLIIHPVSCSFFIPYFKEPNLFTVILFHCYYLPLACQFFTVITISTSRLTVVAFPVKGPIFWARYSKHTIFLIVLCSVIWCLYLFTWTAYIDIRDGRLWLQYSAVIPNAPLWLMPAILAVLCLLVIFLTTVITVHFIYKLKLSSKVVEVNLFWTSFGFSLTTAVVAFYMISMSITANFPDQTWLRGILMSKGYIYDVNCLLPAWLLLFTNRQIRRALLQRKTLVVAPTTVILFSTAS